MLHSSHGVAIRFRLVLWLALGAVPLAVAPGLFVAHDLTPKLLVMAVAVCLCLVSVSDWYPGLAALHRTRRGRCYLGAVALQAVSLTVSTLFSRQVGLSLAGTTWRRYGLATQLAVLLIGLACSGYTARRPECLRGAMFPLLAVGFVISMLGILQLFGMDYPFDRSLYTQVSEGFVRPPATLGHAMYFSAYLLPVICLAAAWAVETIRPIARVWLWSVIGAAAVAIVISGTRSAILGLLAGGAVFGVQHRARIGRRESFLAGAAIAGFCCVLAALFYTDAGSSLRQRAIEWRLDLRGGPRLMIWRDAAGMLRRNLLPGDGLDTFPAAFRAAESPVLARAYPDFYMESPHNLVLEIGLAQGAPGLLALALLIGGALAGGRNPDPRFASIATGLRSALVAILVALQFIPLTVANALWLHCLIGMSTALGSSPVDGPAPARLVRPLALTAAPAFMAVAILFAVQDWWFARAGDALRRKHVPEAAANFVRAHRFSFPEPAPDLWLSRQFAAVALQDPAQAGTALRLAADAGNRAELYSEEPFNAYYQSAVLAIGVGDLKVGEQKLRSAVESAPAWYKPHMLLAQTLLLTGRIDEGKEHARIATGLAGARKPEVERAIQDLLETLGRQDRLRRAAEPPSPARGPQS